MIRSPLNIPRYNAVLHSACISKTGKLGFLSLVYFCRCPTHLSPTPQLHLFYFHWVQTFRWIFLVSWSRATLSSKKVFFWFSITENSCIFQNDGLFSDNFHRLKIFFLCRCSFCLNCRSAVVTLSFKMDGLSGFNICLMPTCGR